MSRMSLSRRQTLLGLAGSLGGLSMPLISRAQNAGTPVKLITSWYAQAEFGGFYQALAKGYYAQEGLDVTIEAASPQMNVPQLLAAGRADFITGYDFQLLSAVASGIPLVAVASTFQHDQQGLMTHAGVTDLAQLREHPILIAASSHATFWPWLKNRFGYREEQARPYSFNLQPFFLDPEMAVQAYASSELWDARQKGMPVEFFLFKDLGYPPYGAPMATTQHMVATDKKKVSGFVKASLMGWRDYFQNPDPGNALILKANPNMTLEHLAFGYAGLKKADALSSPDVKERGLGAMTLARWQATRDFMVSQNLLPADADWTSAFTTEFVDTLRVMPA
ncbi:MULTISPECIES: ABC transporter substrate-binding protein [unclassified Gluconobacter]|uniref:ABC transporter substrate-binding protein n=1 Tax=unclassified Gluconobacter TaxID=2644261 RepID=UPI001C04A3AE